MDLDHLLEGFSGEHRDVTIGDDDLAVKLAQPLETTGDGVAGAFLLGLNSGGDVGGVISQMGLYLIATMSDDHDEMLWVESACRSYGPRQHGSTGNLVEQFGLRGLHAGATASSQHDDGGHSVDLGSVSGRAGRHGALPVRMRHAGPTVAVTRSHRTVRRYDRVDELPGQESNLRR